MMTDIYSTQLKWDLQRNLEKNVNGRNHTV